jgi:uncharacterized membrane protein
MIVELIGFFRIVFGLFFLLVVPGYAVTLALFPKMDDLEVVERIGFACALSIAADLLTTLFIDLALHIPTTAVNILIALLMLTVLALVIWKGELYFMKRVDKKREGLNLEEVEEERGGN